MNDIPTQETTEPREIDHGELSRPSEKHLRPGPLTTRDKKVLFGFLAAAATVAFALVALAK
jgi:hypothetical protein